MCERFLLNILWFGSKELGVLQSGIDFSETLESFSFLDCNLLISGLRVETGR